MKTLVLKGINVQELLKAGIIDLGGNGSLFLEIEYNNSKKEFKEAIYRLPNSCNNQDIITANIFHLKTHSTIVINFNQNEPFTIILPDRCSELVEVRLPEAIGGENITALFG